MRIVDRWWQRPGYDALPFLVSAALVVAYALWVAAKIAGWVAQLGG